MRIKPPDFVDTHRLASAVLLGVVLRLSLAYAGLGLWNAGHDHLHVLKLATGYAPSAVAQNNLTAPDPSWGFGDGLLRPLMRSIIDVLRRLNLGAPEDLVLVVGILAVVLRLSIALGLWRLTRGYFGVSRLGHPIWVAVGVVQGALGVVTIGGVLALGPSSEAQLMVHLRADPQARAVVALGATLEPFFLGDRALKLAQSQTLDETWLRQTCSRLELAGQVANRFVFLASDKDKSEVMLILEGQSCPAPQLFVGSWLDRLAVWLDAARHVRRGALLLYACSNTTDVAQARSTPQPLRYAAARRAVRLGTSCQAPSESCQSLAQRQSLGPAKAPWPLASHPERAR